MELFMNPKPSKPVIEDTTSNGLMMNPTLNIEESRNSSCLENPFNFALSMNPTNFADQPLDCLTVNEEIDPSLNHFGWFDTFPEFLINDKVTNFDETNNHELVDFPYTM